MMRTNNKILIVVETTKRANTDVLYIDKSIRYFYNLENNIKLDYEFLTSKTKYNDLGNLSKINKQIKDFNNAVVIYCIDTDEISNNPVQVELNQKIEEFCKKKKYELIWFCRDIEEVFLKKRVNDSEKSFMAKKFGSSNDIGFATEEYLSCNALSKYKSNFLLIFDKYLKRNK